jgi:hypothetical protein
MAPLLYIFWFWLQEIEGTAKAAKHRRDIEDEFGA